MKKTVYWIEGDGVGPEIWRAARPVLDAAVFKAYGDDRSLDWVELPAGEKALKETGDLLPEATIKTLLGADLVVNGPLASEVGTKLRDSLGLYARIRPIRHYSGQACPVKRPELIDMIVFCSGEALGDDNTRLIRRAVDYALERGLPSVTLVVDEEKAELGQKELWGPDITREPLASRVCPEDSATPGALILRTRPANVMFREILLNPECYGVIAAAGTSGLYLSEVMAAQVGGLGLAVEVALSDSLAVFEVRHGPEPELAGKDLANPGGLILCGMLLLERLGWVEAATIVSDAMQDVIESETFTADLGAHVPGSEVVGCAEFGERVIQEM